MKTGKYRERFYRKQMDAQALTVFSVCEGETDLWIAADKDLSLDALIWVRYYRKYVQSYIKQYPEFFKALIPVCVEKNVPAIIKKMADAGFSAGVGPMASVAGAIAQEVGKKLLKKTDQIIIENGGDIFIVSDTERKFSVYAGDSPWTGRIVFKIKPEQTPCGICTSSGTIGHSLSFGNADAVVAMAKDCYVSDAFATALCNRVKKEKDIKKVLEIAKLSKVLTSCIVIFDKKIGIWGDISLC